jgi:uncharacterized Zn-binding protein involved in type VI secretion
MRKRECKVGVSVHHRTTGRHLGEITAVGSSVVTYTGRRVVKGLAAFGEIDQCDCEVAVSPEPPKEPTS